MEIRVEPLELMLDKATKKAKTNRERISLLNLAETINESLPLNFRPLGRKYIYETIDLSIKKAKKRGEKMVSVDKGCLNSLAYYIGFRDVEHYLSHLYPLIRQEVFALEGNWYSIARCNSGLPDILVSPVRITIDGNTVEMELFGKQRTFTGVVRWIAGSISCFLSTEYNMKSLHLVFKLGVIKEPKLLLGVFSGVSSSGNPIAGREMLWRPDKDIKLESMKHSKLHIEEMLKLDKPPIPHSIIQYFADFNKNYLKIGEVGTFDIDGL